jgi:hypothetical protein
VPPVSDEDMPMQIIYYLISGWYKITMC